MNITLIGMPSSGKSMVGVLLAKRMGLSFTDTDLLIQNQEKRLLSEIIEEEGLERFLEIENQVNTAVCVENTVIAPGGSVCYGTEAMMHLKAISTVVYLKVSLEEIKKRVGNLQKRGVAVPNGQTFEQLYQERTALYEQYADMTVDEAGMTSGEVVEYLVNQFHTENH